MARLLTYGNETIIVHNSVVVVDISEKKTGQMEFCVLCRIPEGRGRLDARYTIELDDGRRGTVIVVRERHFSDFIELTLDGEGELEYI